MMNTKKKPLVTVAVLVYKNFHYIKDCVNSILEQDYPEIQMIISDDGSEVFDGAAIEKYIKENNRGNIKSVFVHTMEKNVGTCKNFNYALGLAKGKYVKFIAADDLFYDVNSLSHLVTVAENESSNVVIARAPNYDMYLERQEWTYPSDEHWKQLKGAAKNPKEFFGIMSPWSLISAPATLFNRAFLNKYGGADEKYLITEDWPLWMKMLRKGDEFTLLDESVVIYRSGGVSNGKENPSYARYQIEHADVIKNECLPYPEMMASRDQYLFAKKSEREHRFNGERILVKNESLFKKAAFLISYMDLILGKVWFLCNSKFWNAQEHKRTLLLYGVIMLTLCSITDSAALFDLLLSTSLAETIGRVLHYAGIGLGWAALGSSLVMHALVFPVKLWNTIKYSAGK